MSATRAAARPARTLMVLAALVLLPGCMTEKPVVEATGVPVGAGVDVPPGSSTSAARTIKVRARPAGSGARFIASAPRGSGKGASG